MSVTDRLTDREWEEIAAAVQEYGPESFTPDDARELGAPYSEGGANGGGNKWGLLGSCVALEIDRKRDQRSSP